MAAMAAGLAVWCGPGCTKSADTTSGTPAPRTIRIGMVAKSETNDVFQAAHQGALDAAAEALKNYGVKVDIVWRTPTEEDAQKQAQYISSLANEKVDGMTVSCTDARILTPAINDAVDKGIPVVCFDSDAPDSKRLCDYGTADFEYGGIIIAELAKVMNDQGTIAMLAGNPGGTNIQHRVDGAKAELLKHPNMKLVSNASNGIIHHEENPEKAVEAIKGAMAANPGQIQGWAILGGWPLWTSNALDWPPGTVKVVCGDALPKQLPYLTDGHAQLLLAQDCYGWGYKTVNILLDKIVKNVNPSASMIPSVPTKVTKDGNKANGEVSVADFSSYWDKWLKK
jgi:ribose transport system substrate-binding protein